VNNRLLRKAWDRLLDRPLHRWSLVVLLLSGFVLLTTPPRYPSYSTAQALFLVALVILVIGYLNLYLDLQRTPAPAPLPTGFGGGTPPRPRKESPFPYPTPDAPIDEAKRRMQMLNQFTEDATDHIRDEIAREAARRSGKYDAGTPKQDAR